MKHFALAAILAAGFAGAASADPIEGRWRTAQDDNGHSGLIEIKPCGNAICGTLIRAYDSAGNQIESDNVGRRLIWDTTNRGGGEYRGRIFSPDRGKEYASKLMLSGDRLTVSGCVLGICRSGGTWSRSR